MRLLAGADRADGDARRGCATPIGRRWSPGPWLAETLKGLRSPEGWRRSIPAPRCKATLRPYQQVGVRWLYLLAKLGLGACLADDMGLGKTIQVLSLLLVLKRAGGAASRSRACWWRRLRCWPTGRRRSSASRRG